MIKIKQLLDFLVYAAAILGAGTLYIYLDRPVQAFLPLALLAGIFCDRQGRHLFPAWLATLFSIFLFIAYALQITSQNVVPPAVNILALLLAIRLVSSKEPRHYLQIFVLALFAIAGSTLLTLTPFFFPALLFLVLCVTVGLVLLTFHAADPELAVDRRQLRQILGTALIFPGASLVLMLGFFVILPRTNYPLWDFLNPAAPTRPVLSDQVRPGEGSIRPGEGGIAFRVETTELAPEDLYWRGTVLNSSNGGNWEREPPPPGEESRLVDGRAVQQTFYLDARPMAGGALVALDHPQELGSVAVRRSPDLVHTVRSVRAQRFRYQATSQIGSRLQAAGEIDRDFYLKAERLPPRMAELVRGIAAPPVSEREKIERLKEFYRRQKLTYALSDLPQGEAALEEFLFDRKRGYCEFFASSFALLLRHSGVPARLVGGYQGGEYNTFGGYYLVSEDSAHVWVEALVDREWVRIDPTLLAHQVPASPSASGSLSLFLDFFDYWWTRAVIAYDLDQQIGLLKEIDLEVKGIELPKKAPPLWLGLTAVVVLLLVYRREQEPEERALLRQFLRRVRRRYRLAPIPRSTGLLELAERTNNPLCREFVDIYAGAVYRDRLLTSGEKRRLRRLLRQF